MRTLRWVLLAPASALGLGWACAALYIDGPASRPVAALLAGGFALTCLLLVVRLRWRGLAVCAAVFLAVLLWWLSIPPSNDRDWQRDVARLPTASFDGDRVTIRNVRDFDYRSETDYVERWEVRTYDLAKLEGVDMFLSYWGSPWIAHTIASWAFSDGQHLAISIETRKEQGEEYSALLGFFRQFEIYYVVADERDVVKLRTNYRGEDVYLYRLTTPVEQARAVLIDYLEAINRLAREAEWYNAATLNCTTSIRRHVQNVSPGHPFDWRILVNGRIDQLGYERGTIDTSLPFEELRRRSAITEKARALGAGDFSAGIRAGLPDPRRGSAMPPRGGATLPVAMATHDATDRRSRIEAKLRETLDARHVEVIDESHLHAGHAGAARGGGHFRALIVSERFDGLPPLARQRLVYGALAEEMRGEIHALSMRVLTPAEWTG